MSDHLKSFIQEHPGAFDLHPAPDLWPQLSAGLRRSQLIKPHKSFIRMVRFGFGASVIAVAAFALFQTKEETSRFPAAIHLIESAAPPPQAPPVSEAPPPVALPLPIAAPEAPPAGPVHVAQAPDVPVRAAGATEETVPERPQSLDFSVGSLYPASGKDLKTLDTLFRGIRHLRIESSLCNVSVVTGSQPELHVKAEMTDCGMRQVVVGTTAYKNNEVRLEFHREGETLVLRVHELKLDKWVKVKSGLRHGSISVVAPELLTCEIDNGSGSVTLSGLRNTSLTCKTGSGCIKADSLSGKIRVSTGSGAIHGNQLQGEIELLTASGNQNLQGLEGTIRVAGSSGSVRILSMRGTATVSTTYGNVSITTTNGPLWLSASSGSIRLSEANGPVHAKTSYGNIQLSQVNGDIQANASSGHIVLRETRGALRLQTSYGHIKGKEVVLEEQAELSSSSGNIHLSFVNPMKDLEFDLSSSTGNLTVNKDGFKEKATKSLKTGSAPLKVKASSVYGSQVYD